MRAELRVSLIPRVKSGSVMPAASFLVSSSWGPPHDSELAPTNKARLADVQADVPVSSFTGKLVVPAVNLCNNLLLDNPESDK